MVLSLALRWSRSPEVGTSIAACAGITTRTTWSTPQAPTTSVASRSLTTRPSTLTFVAASRASCNCRKWSKSSDKWSRTRAWCSFRASGRYPNQWILRWRVRWRSAVADFNDFLVYHIIRSFLEQVARDYHAHYLVCALKDLVHAQVPHHLLDPVVPKVPVSAVHLQRVVCHARA